jgi:site-specific DNA-cytosine methylase
MTEIRNVNVGHICCGIGGGAAGFNRGQARVKSMKAKFICLGGIDVDPACCADFEMMAGVKATRLDLMTVGQYIAFHGRQPPSEWREAMPDDIRRAFRNEHPHILFMSMPCKGFSGLLSEKISVTAKYQALNGLTLRGLWLALEAYQDDPVELILFENVPRIATRGRWLLDQIVPLLRAYGYIVNETKHDCGEIGRLAQHRDRFLIVARHAAKVPEFLYEPKKHSLLGVGEILSKLPLPGLIDAAGVPLGGPMHRVPRLQWKTWVRLAFVEAGSDWRSLNKLKVENGFLSEYGLALDGDLYNGADGVCAWDEPSGAIATHTNRPASGKFSVADPRVDGQARRSTLGVHGWDEPSGLIAGESFPSNGAFAVADPRVDGHPKSVQLGVRPWDKPAGVVTGKMIAGGGPHSVADPRIGGKPRFNNVYRIVRFDEPSPAVAGPGGPAGGLCVADPRAHSGFGGKGKYRVTGFNEPAGTVISGSTTGQGAFAVADPRWRAERARYVTSGHYGVVLWDRPSGAVTGSGQHDNRAASVADPRIAHALPDATDNLTCMIRALDGTWHRPFTTLECAALQSLVDPDEPFDMCGTSDSAKRERIGNCVPSDAAAAIAGVMGTVLLLVWSGEKAALSDTPVWVRDIAVALSVKPIELPA